ncbi:type IV pilus twitching motility protein PilT [Candidatus Methylacidithermus pantelleriae]|nr:ATPase, T2SS/T4P/T4SS family [Candidatus Methylacidithermus pantelleriae]
MASSFNDFVLQTALERGWISHGQLESIQAARQSLPDVSLADLLYEQQIISVEQRDWLLETYRSQAKEWEANLSGNERSGAAELVPSAVENSTTEEVTESLEILNRYLEHAFSLGATSLHLSPDRPLRVRLETNLQPLYEEAFLIPAEAIEPVAKAILGPRRWERARERGSVSFSYAVRGLGRFRGHLFRERQGCHVVFFMPLGKPKGVEELGLPEVVRGLTKKKGELVLVAGGRGSGRTTTLAALVEEINRTQGVYVVTVEDPMELWLEPKQAMIAQKEVGLHCSDMAAGIEAALAENADVLAIGCLEDPESIRLALEAADRGLLVLATILGNSVPEVLHGLVHSFPGEEEGIVRRLLAELLGGVVCQKLVPCRDGLRKVLASEILLPAPKVVQAIAAGAWGEIPELLRESRPLGMRSMEDSLGELAAKGLVALDPVSGVADSSRAYANWIPLGGTAP